MRIVLPYTELSEYISSHFNKSLRFARISDNQLQVKYLGIRVTVTIVQIRPTAVTIVYSGLAIISPVINKVLQWAVDRNSELKAAVTLSSGNTIAINLAAIERIKSIFDHLSLSGATVCDTALDISLDLK